MDKRTKAVLTVITVCLAIQIDPRTTVASEIDAKTKEVTEARFSIRARIASTWGDCCL